MKRIKIATVVLVMAAAGFGASLGAKALPMSDAQRGCMGNSGLWTEWIDFIELDDGSFEGVTYATCEFGIPDGMEYGYTEYYVNGEFDMGCFDSPTPRCHDGNKGPEPTPTTSPTSTTTGRHERHRPADGTVADPDDDRNDVRNGLPLRRLSPKTRRSTRAPRLHVRQREDRPGGD